MILRTWTYVAEAEVERRLIVFQAGRRARRMERKKKERKTIKINIFTMNEKSSAFFKTEKQIGLYYILYYLHIFLV